MRVHTAEQRDRIVGRGAALAALTKHPSWPDFEAEFHRKADALRARALALALHPSGANQRELDMIRGSLATLSWILAVPSNAEARLERYLREQPAQPEGDEEE